MTKHLTVAALLMISLGACSSGATLVRKDQAGGRIALEGAYVPAMGDARMLMVEHCRGRFEASELGDRIEYRCRRSAPSAPQPLEAELAATGTPAHGLGL